MIKNGEKNKKRSFEVWKQQYMIMSVLNAENSSNQYQKDRSIVEDDVYLLLQKEKEFEIKTLHIETECTHIEKNQEMN